MNKSQNQLLSSFHSHVMRLLAIFGFLPTEMTVFPTLSYTSTSEIPKLPYTWSLEIVFPWGGAFAYRPFLFEHFQFCSILSNIRSE